MTGTSNAPPAVEVENLRYRYGEEGAFRLFVPRVVLPAGATMACIGPSGCGKTTLVHLLAGILQPESGRVVVQGTEWSTRSDAERRAFRISQIGMVFQQFALLDHLTVRENVLLPYFVSPALQLGPLVEERVAALADSTGIAAVLDRRPDDLSQGERQRVAICRALVTEPPLVLADEPTGNLDPDTTDRVLELLLAQVSERGSALVMVTHDHALTSSFDQVLDFDDLLGRSGDATS